MKQNFGQIVSTKHSEFFKWCSVSAVTEDIIPTNKPIKNIKQDVIFMALDKFEEMTLSCASFLVRLYLFISLRFMANKNWLPRKIKEELLLTPSPSVFFFHWIFTSIAQSLLINIQVTDRVHKEMKYALAKILKLNKQKNKQTNKQTNK